MQQDAEWYSLRHRRLLDALERLHRPLPDVFITEAGLDGTGKAPGRPGWQTACAGDIDRYIEQLSWFNDELRKDDILGACLYTSAAPTGQGWDNFELGEQESEALFTHLQQGFHLLWPIKGPHVITSPFGAMDAPKYRKRAHTGIDLRANTRTPVVAAHSGVVEVFCDPATYGLYVTVTRGEWQTMYGHLQDITGKTWQQPAGMTIALSGNSGNSSGPHLHFELRHKGVPVDPMPYLPEMRP
jgi:murein DD-endopeptidase MepM/ murein hydrolase activator NlpD